MGRTNSSPALVEAHPSFTRSQRDTLPEVAPWAVALDSSANEVRCPSCDQPMAIPVSGCRWPARTELGSLLRTATTIAKQTALADVIEMLVHSTERVLVVVDAERRPLGVVTATHVLRALKLRSQPDLRGATAIDVASFGSGPLFETSTIDTALRRFVVDDCDHLVVVDARGKLAGLLMAADLPERLAEEG